MDYLPIFIQLRGSPAVVVGGGNVALRKVDLLLKAGARVTVIAPKLHDELGRSRLKGQLDYVRAGVSSASSRWNVARHRCDGLA